MGAMFHFLKERPSIKESLNAIELPPPVDGYDINFQNVNFCYDPKLPLLQVRKVAVFVIDVCFLESEF